MLAHTSRPRGERKAPAADTGAPRPYAAIQAIGALLADSMGAEELLAFLALPQEALSHGTMARTPFAALRDGATDEVLTLVRWIATPPDGRGAP